MKYLLLIVLLLTCACTTFNLNESGIRKACKGGIKEYNDDSTSFKCFGKETSSDQKN